MAKAGCTLKNTLKIGAGKAHIKAIIDGKARDEWDRRWQTSTNCRQTFELCPATNINRSKEIRKLNRYDLGILIRYVTGHAHLRHHNTKLGIVNPEIEAYDYRKYATRDPDDDHSGLFNTQRMCRLCQLKGRSETPRHILLECNTAWRERRFFFGNHELDLEDIHNWKPKQLVGFFKSLDVENRD